MKTIMKKCWKTSEKISITLDNRQKNSKLSFKPNWTKSSPIDICQLNCFTSVWKSMNSMSCSEMFCLLSLSIQWPIENRHRFRHSLDAIAYKNDPIPRAKTQPPTITMYQSNTYCMVVANKYPIGFLQSNGNLTSEKTVYFSIQNGNFCGFCRNPHQSLICA